MQRPNPLKLLQFLRLPVVWLLATVTGVMGTASAFAITDEALSGRAERALTDRTFATSHSPSPEPLPRSGQRTYRAVRDACWSSAALQSLRCERVRLRDQSRIIQDRYHRSAVQRWVSDPSSNFSSEVTRGLGGIGRQLNDYLSSGPSCRSVSSSAQVCRVPVTDQSEYELFVELLRHRMIELERQAPSPVRDCFRPCFVKCMVSNLLDYTEREDQALGSFLRSRYLDGPAQIFSSARGECAEIALLATDIGRRLGIDSIGNVATLEHEFNQVEIAGRRMSFDSASPSCLFFEDY